MVEVYTLPAPLAQLPAGEAARFNLFWLTRVFLTEAVLITPFVLILCWRGWHLTEFPLRLTPEAYL
jgi:hypothetical protein